MAPPTHRDGFGDGDRNLAYVTVLHRERDITVQFDGAAFGSKRPGHQSEQGRLARPVGAHDRRRSSAGDLQRQFTEHAGCAVAETHPIDIDVAHHWTLPIENGFH
jgi:hypothetical protein